jgi:exosome complex component RRP41
MSYKKRYDNRKFDELRPIEAKVGVVPNADGSAYFKIGNTTAYAAVYGPRSLYPRFLQDPKKGIVRCYYEMMPFSGMGNRVRPGPNRRAKEISFVMAEALSPVLKLEDFPNSTVDIFVNLPQTDAGSRCASLCAASLALADAGVPMYDLLSSVAVGRVDDKLVVDLEYNEEAYPDGPVADIPIAMIPSTKEITLLQCDGEITKEMLAEILETAKPVMDQIREVQKKALEDKFGKEFSIIEED